MTDGRRNRKARRSGRTAVRSRFASPIRFLPELPVFESVAVRAKVFQVLDFRFSAGGSLTQRLPVMHLDARLAPVSSVNDPGIQIAFLAKQPAVFEPEGPYPFPRGCLTAFRAKMLCQSSVGLDPFEFLGIGRRRVRPGNGAFRHVVYPARVIALKRWLYLPLLKCRGRTSNQSASVAATPYTAYSARGVPSSAMAS